MKAVISERPHTTKIIDIKEPYVRAAHEVKVKIAYSGIAGNDLQVWLGLLKVPRKIPILGHFGSGVIVEVGKEAEENGWVIGDRVSADTIYSCGRCYNCQRGHTHVCLHVQSVPSMAEYVIWNYRKLYRIPDTKSLQEGAFFLPLCEAMHAADIMQIALGSSVLIMGAGISGLLLLQLAIKSGAVTVAVIDPQEKKRRLAQGLGAHHVLDFVLPNTFIQLMQVTDGKGFDFVIDAATNTEALEWASGMLASKGTLLLYSLYHPNASASFDLNALFYKEACIKTARSDLNMLSKTAELLPYLELKSLITGEFPLSDVNKAYAEKAQGKHAMILVRF